ncbi:MULTISPECIES: short-chain dehydrogenase [Ureibacillus]|jgi:formate hydrogenlyase subunit 3/multisubunit Na+/H+ antiporter MnhD subunit|nr:short-chain dehydrogenase [Ureibacillus thermosphaericus]
MMMGGWTIPTIIVGLIIVGVSYVMTVSVMKKTEERASAMDTPISKTVREHPILMNPIIIMYIIFGIFTGIMIFYYWAKSASY